MTQKYLPLLAFIPLLLLACKKNYDGNPGPQGSQGETGIYYGSITGHISLYDQRGAKLDSPVNVTVRLNDSISTITDAQGAYTITNVPTGNYAITASKDGYGTTKASNVTVLKDVAYTNLKLSAKPDFDISDFKVVRVQSITSHLSLVNRISLSAPPYSEWRKCIIFVSNKPAVSNTNYLMRYVCDIRSNSTGPALGFLDIPATDLNNLGIFFGDIVYYAAYSYILGDASAYEDARTGQIVYTSLGTRFADTALAP